MGARVEGAAAGGGLDFSIMLRNIISRQMRTDKLEQSK